MPSQKTVQQERPSSRGPTSREKGLSERPSGAAHSRRQRWWEETNVYGRSRARRLGINEKDVDELIHEFRKQKRGKRAAG